MSSKLNVVVLSLLYLLVSSQGTRKKRYDVPEPDDVAKYYDCWNYQNCVLGDKGFQHFKNCVSVLPKKEFFANLNYTEVNFFKHQSKTVPEIYKEVCTYKEDKRKKAFDKTFSGSLYYRKLICNMEDKQGECSRMTQSLGCIFNYLDQLADKGKCTIGN